jgi:hypothetical protein
MSRSAEAWLRWSGGMDGPSRLEVRDLLHDYSSRRLSGASRRAIEDRVLVLGRGFSNADEALAAAVNAGVLPHRRWLVTLFGHSSRV